MITILKDNSIRYLIFVFFKLHLPPEIVFYYVIKRAYYMAKSDGRNNICFVRRFKVSVSFDE